MIDNKNLLKLLRTELQKMNNGDKTKFLTYKKESNEYGYEVGKISMKEKK